MSIQSTKFGTFKGVFTPSILSILGVIMYLRLPWIVGEAGLFATIGIILVAHLISITTGLSISSIATDKKVEKGGMYYMISRSLGLPIGGTLGLAFFVGLSFSVSLYLIGFSEVFLTALGFEITKDMVRLTGAAALLVVTILTFISTNLALKTQVIILIVMALSVVSIIFGEHELGPRQPVTNFASDSLPWIAVFAIFFPAVTGFGTGASMSGDLRDPKKAIPIGTIGAIIVGFIVYIGLSIFLAHTVNRQALAQDPGVLLNISLFAPIVIAGIWCATLSSALGSILGAPRILQATAIDKITPKVFAKGFGAASEPRNALMLTFVIALAGILIGDLNIIARLVTIFFIITYGFLNLTCAIENWAGSDFRPSFRIPVIISILGSVVCFIVMIQLDLIAMIVAIIILGSIFLYIKSKELHLQSGDTWAGFWSSIVKYGLKMLSVKGGLDKRNWRPNIILFSGGIKSRPYLIEIARSMVGRMGVFTNFELIETPGEKVLFSKQAQSIIDTDNQGKPVFTRRHECSDIYQGMDLICRVYGFSGFEPNTILLGWSGKTKSPEKYTKSLKNFIQLNYNIAILSFDKDIGFGNKKQIDIWWKGYGRELSYGLTLLKFITSDPVWRSAQIRIIVINYESHLTEKIYDLANQVLDNTRLFGDVKVINNNVEKIPEIEIIKKESLNTDLSILPVDDKDLKDPNPLKGLSEVVDQLKTTLILKAGSEFDEVNVFGDKETEKVKKEIDKSFSDSPLISKIEYPRKDILANEMANVCVKFQDIHTKFLKNGFGQVSGIFIKYLDGFKDSPKKILPQLEKILEPKKKLPSKNPLDKYINDFAYKLQNQLHILDKEILPGVKDHLLESVNTCIDDIEAVIAELPASVLARYDQKEFALRKKDKTAIKLFKIRKKIKAWILRRPVKQKVELKNTVRLFLFNRRLDAINHANNQFRVHSYKMVSSLKNFFSDTLETLEKIQKNMDDHENAKSIARLEGLRLEKRLEEIIQDTKSTFENINNKLYSDLFINLQKVSYILDNPAWKFSIKPYQKALKRNVSDIHNLQQMPEIWLNNMNLFINKSNLEFLLITFKKRIDIKLNKKISELQIYIDTNLIQTLKKIKEQVNLLSPGDDSKGQNTLRPLFEKEISFDLNDYFDQFFNEMHDIIQKLPGKTVINDDQFVQQLEKGLFVLSDKKSINVRKNVEFYIGTELINNARQELDNITNKLNEASHNIHDIIRLTLFNLENVPKQKDKKIAEPVKQEEYDSLLQGLLDRIKKEESLIEQLKEQVSYNLNSYLETAYEHINIISLAHRAEPSRKKSRKTGNSLKRYFDNRIAGIRLFYRDQMVRAIYTKSESVMIAQKWTTFEKKHMINSQAIHEILENITPSKQILEQIPYYYMSIFSVSSIINKDFWVGMEKQLYEAKKVYKRFENGYPGGLLVTGERNSGKSSLAKIIANTVVPGLQTHFIKAPDGNIPNDEIFDNILKSSFNTEIDIYDYLNVQPANKVIVIDDLELWWYRSDEGSYYLKKILELVDRFSGKFFFMVVCKTYAYNFLNTIYELDNYFLGHVRCEPLDARELKEMIMLRHKAGGLKFKLNSKSEDDFSEWDYAKLFNRYFEITKGNPGQTTKAWISNIKSIKGQVMEIRSPGKITNHQLQDIGDDLWLVILQFILHRRLSTEKLSKVLCQSESQVISLLKNMLRAGIVEEKFEGIYALNAYLEPVFVRSLKKKEML